MFSAVKALAFAAFAASVCCLPPQHPRAFDRRTDLANIPSVDTHGWTVPLQGGLTCSPNNECHDSLIRPPSNQTLKALALGRGVYNYSCSNELPANAPLFVSQYTELYNAAPLIAKLPNEASFHNLIPQLYDYDYGELRNSTLECIGSIGTLTGDAVVILYDIGTFEADVIEWVNSPDDPTFNGIWAHSVSHDRSWNIYRVESAGGAVPHACSKLNDTLEIQYAAEYWFYHG